MAANKTLLILPGDGIGPEVMTQVRRIVDWFDKRRAVGFDILEQPVGGAAYDLHGTPLTDEAMAEAMDADAVLLGAVGGPQYDTPHVTSARRPACCACARRWACSPICGRRWCSTRLSTPRP